MKVVQCEVFTRVVGYYRPVQQFNEGKVQEFKDRVTYTEDKAVNNEKFKASVDCGKVESVVAH